jgi:hypothetical protein
MSVHQPLCFLLNPGVLLPSSSSAMKTPYNTEDHSDDPRPINEEDIQMKYSSDYLYIMVQRMYLFVLKH